MRLTSSFLFLVFPKVIHAQRDLAPPLLSQLSDDQLHERLLTEARAAARGAQDDVAEISQLIRDLKRQSNPDQAKIQELEQQRILLLRQQMIARQFHGKLDTRNIEF